MTDQEKLALAVLRSGESYAEAMRQSGLTLEQVQALWKEYGRAKRN
jgi:hypothetical protein